jgi:hypothetical protein
MFHEARCEKKITCSSTFSFCMAYHFSSSKLGVSSSIFVGDAHEIPYNLCETSVIISLLDALFCRAIRRTSRSETSFAPSSKEFSGVFSCSQRPDLPASARTPAFNSQPCQLRTPLGAVHRSSGICDAELANVSAFIFV